MRVTFIGIEIRVKCIVLELCNKLNIDANLKNHHKTGTGLPKKMENSSAPVFQKVKRVVFFSTPWENWKTF